MGWGYFFGLVHLLIARSPCCCIVLALGGPPTELEGERAVERETEQQDYLSQDDLLKAREAEKEAARARDTHTREDWLKIAECYRELAREA